MPTVSVENYLKAIYHLQSDVERVKTKAIALRLAVTLPSVTNMVQALAQDSLIDYQPYRGVRLTEAGHTAALRVIRKHRLIEMFLVETLGFSWDEVHAEAEALEHAASDKLAAKIDEFLGFPKFDPHGDPIPSADGVVDQRETISLADVAGGNTIRILRVLDQSPTVLRYLSETGLIPNSVVEVVAVLPFDGQMTIRLQGREVSISRTLANRLRVVLEHTATELEGPPAR
jgi:DtxR family transcriptional regulator, Mn-dependent transcriptional regulator